MKTFITVFALAFVCVSAHDEHGKGGPHGGPPGKAPWDHIPGCNMSSYPKDVNASICCVSKPGCIMKMNGSFEANCKTACPKSDNRSSDWCCFTKCALKQAGVISADGTFDRNAVVTKLTAATNKTDIWSSVIQTVVDQCIADGPNLHKEWLNSTKKNSSCDVAVNRAIEQCIKRQLFLQCPASEKNSSSSCLLLFDFAKSCPAYPFIYHGPGKGQGHGKDHHSKERDTTGKGSGPKSTTGPALIQGKEAKAAPTKPTHKATPTKPTHKGAPTTVKSG